MAVKSQASRPRGCIVNLATGAVLYNTHATGGASYAYKAVCSASAFPPAANRSRASGDGYLCAHKLDHCDDHPTEPRLCKEDRRSDTLHATYYWTEERCRLRVQVHVDGRAARVDVDAGGSDTATAARLQPDSENWFRVRWAGGAYPTAAAGCGVASCVVARRAGGGDTCVCDVTVATVAAFTDGSALPTAAQAERTLFIGAPPPTHFDDGTYTACATAACAAAAAATPRVRVFTRGTALSPRLDATAIFEVVANQTAGGGRTLHLANKVSTVAIAAADGAAAYSFRNPPHFVPLLDGSARDAMYETEALLDHLFWHASLAPFVGLRLVQHLVTSNPSPRYMAAVTSAFRTGAYGGATYSGAYGDLGAAVAAILLDREARSLVLTADPTHGHLREPLSRLYHVLRAFAVTTRVGRAVEMTSALLSATGQAPLQAPSVFNFYSPEFAPAGVVAASGLVAPEAQLGVLPLVLGLLDGLAALFFDGLSACEGGLFVAPCTNLLPPYPAAWATAGAAAASDGYLTWRPADATSAAAVVDELSLLLTGGRLDAHARAAILDEYEWQRARSACPNDRTAELCGRLLPGTQLLPGDALVNAAGETLCFSHDGVARHLAADGTEAFSTAPQTRERGTRLAYDAADFLLRVTAPGAGGSPAGAILFRSDAWYNGGLRAFHPFLHGPCYLYDPRAYELRTVHKLYSGGSDNSTLVSCAAADTCASPAPAPPPSAAYAAERARSDAAYAVRVAQTLMTSAAAFAATNEPRTLPTAAPARPARVSLHRPYKALVVLFMRGGADTFNLLVPTGECDGRRIDEQYRHTRTAVALPDSAVGTRLLPIRVPNGTQPCGAFGVHSSLPTLRQLFEDGDLAFYANAGALRKPITKDEFLRGAVETPPQLFAHNTQQAGAESLHPQEAFGDGVMGRLINELEAQGAADGVAPLSTQAYAVTASQHIFRGATSLNAVVLSAADGMLTLEGSRSAKLAGNDAERNRTLAALRRVVGHDARSLYAQTHNAHVRESLDDSERIATQLESATLGAGDATWRAARGGQPVGDLVEQLEQVSRVIAQRSAFETERDLFLVELGGFDTHSMTNEKLADQYGAMEAAFGAFAAELKAQGVWERTTLVGISEFGRTMTTNGRGTDHAWGGNYFVFGGDVRGGVVHGVFPELRVDGPDSISGTGQMLPTTPWEGVWTGLAQWLGVRDDRLGAVMPNLREFGPQHLHNASKVFKSF